MSGAPVSEEQPRPLLRVVRGTPSDEELAALTAIVAAATIRASGDAPARPCSPWGDPGNRLRVPLHPGPGTWCALALAR